MIFKLELDRLRRRNLSETAALTLFDAALMRPSSLICSCVFIKFPRSRCAEVIRRRCPGDLVIPVGVLTKDVSKYELEVLSRVLSLGGGAGAGTAVEASIGPFRRAQRLTEAVIRSMSWAWYPNQG